MSIMEMEEIKSAIAGVDEKVEYNGGGIETLLSNALLNAGSVVKSVQRGVMNLDNQKPTAYTPISTINPDKAVAIVSVIGHHGGNHFTYNLAASYTLQSNRLVISDIDQNDWTAGVSWQVIEFY